MAAKQHFNNFMIVVPGSHRERSREREKRERKEDRGKQEGGKEGGKKGGGVLFRGRGPEEREKTTESVHPRLNVLCHCRLCRREA